MPSLEKIGLGLQGFGAGLLGQGAQFQQQLAGQRANEQKRLDQLSAERQQALANDFGSAFRFINEGRPDLAKELIGDRLRAGSQIPDADMSETQALFTALDTAQTPEEFNLIRTELADDVSLLQAQGLLPVDEKVSALDQARTGEILAKTAKLEAETAKLTNRQPADEKTGLELERLRLQIANENASSEARKIKASQAAEQRDSTAISKSFDSLAAIDAVDSLLVNDEFRSIYGVADQFIPTIFPDAVGKEALRDQVVGLLSLENRQKLKGQGTITDSEAKTLAQSATILANPGISEDSAKRELIRVKGIFNRSLAQSVKNPVANAAIQREIRTKQLLKTLPDGSTNNGDGTFTLPTGEVVEPE
jgi:hypothetical protein